MEIELFNPIWLPKWLDWYREKNLNIFSSLHHIRVDFKIKINITVQNVVAFQYHSDGWKVADLLESWKKRRDQNKRKAMIFLCLILRRCFHYKDKFNAKILDVDSKDTNSYSREGYVCWIYFNLPANMFSGLSYVLLKENYIILTNFLRRTYFVAQNFSRLHTLSILICKIDCSLILVDA